MLMLVALVLRKPTHRRAAATLTLLGAQSFFALALPATAMTTSAAATATAMAALFASRSTTRFARALTLRKFLIARRCYDILFLAIPAHRDGRLRQWLLRRTLLRGTLLRGALLWLLLRRSLRLA